MPGGLMQLLSVGAQDAYLTVSPEMSYFKQVYKRPSNFSMQSVITTFNSQPFLSGQRQIFTCKIGRVGDMLKDVSISFTLPAIYSDDNLRFRWVNNFTNYMLYSYSLVLDTQLIDQRWGEWMDIWNELSLSTDKKQGFDMLTGNVEEYMNPKAQTPMVTIKNNRIAYSYYPVSTGPTSPSLAARSIYIPLDFWFCKNPSLALPLIGLQYQTVTVSVELRSVEDLYQVYDSNVGLYVSPSQYNATHSQDMNYVPVNISTFTAYGGGGPSTVDLNASLECNYIFLDTPERTFMAGTSIDYLIERITRDDGNTGVVSSYTANMSLQNPIKEMVWVLRRSDANLYNDWANYTAAQPSDVTQPPLANARILWNGLERFEQKRSAYFNQLQPYQCHTSSPREGIYVYSFALMPEKVQPSGSFNATMLQQIQLQLTANPFSSTTNTNVSTTTQYALVIYTIQYNVFRMIAGSGGMVFTL
jgi:hypothetical protein